MHGRLKALAVALVGAGLLVPAQSAYASDAGVAPAPEAPAPMTQAQEQVVGDNVAPTDNGLYEVKIPGPNLLTHGPDTRSEMNAVSAGVSSAGGVGFDQGDLERAPVCGTDYFQHVLYARTPSTPDQFAQDKPLIQAAIRRMDAVLNADAVLTGGTSADFKVLCDGSGQVRVDEFTSPTSNFDDIVAAARAVGFDAPNADYTIFFDGGSGVCGVGSYIDDQRLTASNDSNSGGGYGVSYKGCWFNETPMHEAGHTEGAVQYGAPNSTGTGGHCNDGYDVMCYSPDGGDLRQGGLVVNCADRIHFDCGGNDYFNPNPAPGSYLATHWNLGSRLNHFIAFGQSQPSAPGLGAIVNGVTGAVTGTLTALVNGQGVASKAAAPGGWQYFTLRVKATSSALTATIAGDPSSNLDLFLRPRFKPTSTRYLCASRHPAANESCRIADPTAGVWYAGVRTTSGVSGSAFRVRLSQTR